MYLVEPSGKLVNATERIHLYSPLPFSAHMPQFITNLKAQYRKCIAENVISPWTGKSMKKELCFAKTYLLSFNWSSNDYQCWDGRRAV